jgi:hypothetical protein
MFPSGAFSSKAGLQANQSWAGGQSLAIHPFQDVGKALNLLTTQLFQALSESLLQDFFTLFHGFASARGQGEAKAPMMAWFR